MQLRNSVGSVHPHVEIKIVDPTTGRIVPRGVPGELCTRGYSVMLGYWNDPRATRDCVGGKGMSLAKLSLAGLPVPPGFHITTDAYRRFVAANGLQPQIIAALHGRDLSVPGDAEAASAAIAELFCDAPIPAYARGVSLPVTTPNSFSSIFGVIVHCARSIPSFVNVGGTGLNVKLRSNTGWSRPAS